MSSKTDSYSSNSIASEVRTEEFVPCVRYGGVQDGRLRQPPGLHRVDEPMPNWTEFASPVYLLSDDQYDRLTDCESGWVGSENIATVLQNECETPEEEGEVLYPVYIESDALENGVATETLYDWYERFLDRLGLDAGDATYYFSGNRSIHVHVPRFVVGEKEREALKQEAEEFCEETGADLDCGIYSKKGLFRLPGVEHSRTDLPKVRVNFGCARGDIASKAANADEPWKPDTFAELLDETFGRRAQSISSNHSLPDNLSPEVADAIRVLGGNEAVLSLVDAPGKVDIPLVERKKPPETIECAKWLRYNRQPFSPYAHTGGGDRSVAVVNVKGKPFCRKRIKEGSRGNFIPTHILGAVGGDEDFTMQGDAPLRLSKFDFEKWHENGFERGDTVVVIGGRSRRSKIFKVDGEEAHRTKSYLMDDGKQKALLYLKYKDYDVGSAGSEYGGGSGGDGGGQSSGRTKAGDLQRAVEEGRTSIQSLPHQEKLRIANRLLRMQGYDEAFDWFRDAFGPDFDEGITRRQLRSVARRFDDLEVEVP